MAVVAKGPASNVVKKRVGKYDKYSFEVDGQEFTDVYFGNCPIGFADDMEVEVSSRPGKYGTEYTVKALDAPKKSSSAGSKSSGGSAAGMDRDTYMVENGQRIGRQAAVNTAISFLNLVAPHGGVPKKVLADSDLMLQFVFKYANLIEDATADASVFEKMPQFDGSVNEGGAAAEDEGKAE